MAQSLANHSHKKNVKMRLLLLILPLIFCCFQGNLKDPVNNYVERYKDLAVVEMHRSGIPASIILAQGLHESRYGESDLAQLANNHFGIKCKDYWIGQRYYFEDDDFDENGEIIKSCFRKYDSDIDSYIDHSNFLMHSSHYSDLFNYPNTDYISWANGLKKSGYATDPKYAEKLVKKIEDLELYKYDFYPYPLKNKIPKG